MLLPEANIVLDEDLRIAAIQRAGQREDFDVLSGGTQEQLAVRNDSGNTILNPKLLLR
jgi:hypothetical protein